MRPYSAIFAIANTSYIRIHVQELEDLVPAEYFGAYATILL